MGETAKKTTAKTRELTIVLDADLFDKVIVELNNRNLKVSDLIALQLRMFVKSKPTFDLDDTLPFGKYAGERVETVCRVNPSYMTWAFRYMTAVKFTDAVGDLLEEIDPNEDAVRF